MLARENVYKLVDEERLKQDVQHGALTVHGHTVMEWAAILRVLLAKQEREWYEWGPRNLKHPLERTVQVAAVATAALEQHGEDLYRRYVQQRSLHLDYSATRGETLQQDFSKAEIRDLFQELRGVAASQPFYDQEKWTRLEALLGLRP